MANDHTAKARALLSRSGYARGGGVSDDDASDRKIAASAVHKHEKHDHKGEPLTKLARGGAAKKAVHVHVNVMQPPAQARPVPVPVAPRPGIAPPGAGAAPGLGAPAGLAPRPPMPPVRPPMPGAPGGGMPVMRRGGKVKMDAGAGGGEGRLEKVEEYGAKRK